MNVYTDHILGVSIFIFDGEPLMGPDRILLPEEGLAECGFLR